MRILTLDRKPKKPIKTRRAERYYAKQLGRLAESVGQLIGGFPPGDPSALPSIENLLRRYADALTPWAMATAQRMIDEVNQDDLDMWQRMGADLSRGIRREIMLAPTGEAMRELMNLQVTLIKSIPLEAAERVHKLTIEGLENSTRAKEIATEILRSNEVAKSRAMCIARTEVARTGANLTQARAEAIGSTQYIWRTSHDADVRSDHKILDGKVFAWNDPPIADRRSGARAHPGCIYNCRCWAYPLLEG